jgi:hypothetical protein
VGRQYNLRALWADGLAYRVRRWRNMAAGCNGQVPGAGLPGLSLWHRHELLFRQALGNAADGQCILRKEVTSIAAALHIERTLYLRRVNITVWGGPAFVLDEYVEFPWGTSEEIEWESDHDLGVVAGLNLLIFDRVGLSSYAAYNGYIQPRITASYRY